MLALHNHAQKQMGCCLWMVTDVFSIVKDSSKMYLLMIYIQSAKRFYK